MLTPRLSVTSAFGIISDVPENCATGGFGPGADDMHVLASGSQLEVWIFRLRTEVVDASRI